MKGILERYRKVVREINSFDFSGLDDSELVDSCDRFRRELRSGKPPESMLPQIFALIKEVFDRRIGIWKLFDSPSKIPLVEAVIRNCPDPDSLTSTFNEVSEKRAYLDDSQIYLKADFYKMVRRIRQPGDGLTFMPYDVQLLGALALYEGKIAEMETGEGKTVSAVFPACLWSLIGKKVHIATTNDYLASRDCAWMDPVFKFLKIKVDCICSFLSDSERRSAYSADVVYGNNYEFGFDYLRDNMKNRLTDRVQGKLEYVIIDEIDSILMDEAGTPLIISSASGDHSNNFWKLRPLVESLLEEQERKVKQFLHEAKTTTDPWLRSIRLVQISKADPWNQELLDYLANNKDAHKMMDAVRGKFASTRSEYKLEEDLLVVIDEKLRTVKLTDRGIAFVDQKLGDRFMALPAEDAQRSEELRNFLQLLRAYTLYRRDEDYIVHSGRIIIVDEFTGRLAFGKKYEEGLHQAIECKEGLRITPEIAISGKITHPNYFRLYEKMVGMTATAYTVAEEFKKLYNLEVIRIPTNKPVIRAELPDRFYKTQKEKLSAIIDEVEQYHALGRPVLVGTRSVEKSEVLSELLTRRGIPHNVLNAKNHAQEAEIIKSAGQPYAVTIATNMAGRGTDIALGKDLYQIAINNYIEHLKKLLNNGTKNIWVNVYSQFEYDMLNSRLREDAMLAECENLRINLGGTPTSDTQTVIDFGLGLHVIGTERHSARRIDDQLTGRAGRQGDPGSSRFFLSLQDDLFRVFGSDEMSNAIEALDQNRRHELEHITRKAQALSEEMEFVSRKYLIERDNIIDKQRKVIYKMRSDLLTDAWTRERFSQLILDFVEDLIDCEQYLSADLPQDQWNLDELKAYCMKTFGVRILDNEQSAYLDLSSRQALDLRQGRLITVDDVKKALISAFEKAYQKREHMLGEAFSRKLERAVILDVLDTAWKDYLSFSNQFDSSMSLRSYVKDSALTDYKRESFSMFSDLLASIRQQSLTDIFTYPLPGEKMDSIRWSEICPRGERRKPISQQVMALITGNPPTARN